MSWNRSTISENNHTYLISDTERLAKVLDRAIEEGLNNIEILSKLVSDSLTEPTVNIADYQKLIQNTTFDFMEFADRNGIDHNIIGGTSDASDRNYYLDAMQGNTGYEMIYNSRATHENLLMFYSPVTFQGEIIGSLVGVFQASRRIAEFLTLDYFGETAVSYLCDNTGRIFAGIPSPDARVESFLSDVPEIGEKTASVIQRALLRHEAASFTCVGNHTGGYLQPLNSTDLFLVQIYPSAVNSRMISSANSIGLILFLILMSIVVLIQSYFYRSYKAHRNQLEAALTEIQQIRKEEARQLKILTSMSEIYYSMHLIDLQENTELEYAAKNQVKDIVKNNMPADAAMRQVMYTTMSDDYLQIGLRFTELSTLPQRMQHKKFISTELLGKNVGWIRLSFITIEADDAGFPRNVVVTTQIIDSEKKKEEQLWKESNTDELTGCLNRRAYEEALLYETNDSENLVYIAMDVNGLKTVNDSLGHAAGDELIIGAAKTMQQCLGNYGKIFRTGGDEFVAIIHSSAFSLTDILCDFEETQAKWHSQLVKELSISTGYVARREFPDLSVSDLARIADQRMYAAKAKHYHSKGIDRRGQFAAQTALCDSYAKILKVNLTEDSYQIISMDMMEQTNEKGFAPTLSGWLTGFGRSIEVYPEDQQEFLQKTDLSYLRDHFRQGNTSIEISYRRLLDSTYKRVRLELVPAKDYTNQNQSMFLFVKQIG